MALIEHLNRDDWEEFLRSTFEYVLWVLKNDRFRSVGSAADDLRSWLAVGGIGRVRRYLDEQMERRRFPASRKSAVNRCIEQLVRKNRRELLDLTLAGVTPETGRVSFDAGGLSVQDVQGSGRTHAGRRTPLRGLDACATSGRVRPREMRLRGSDRRCAWVSNGVGQPGSARGDVVALLVTNPRFAASQDERDPPNRPRNQPQKPSRRTDTRPVSVDTSTTSPETAGRSSSAVSAPGGAGVSGGEVRTSGGPPSRTVITTSPGAGGLAAGRPPSAAPAERMSSAETRALSAASKTAGTPRPRVRASGTSRNETVQSVALRSIRQG